MMLHRLCRLYPAWTPDTAADAPAWVLRHVALLEEAGVIGNG
jgi:hypothetical protein